jgi:hypothetical protein
MIAKGNVHNDGVYLARYLAVSSQGTERAEVGELRGFATDSVFDALALVQLQSQGTHCQKPIFHVQVRLPEKENLTRAQWFEVTNRIEHRLGFDGQPRAVVFHQKEGGEHMHIAWSRIGEDMRAIDPGLFKLKLKEVCRELEREMGLQAVKNEREPSERTRPANRGEYEEARRLKTDLKAIRESIRDCLEESHTATGFAAALEEKGFVLARGDRRAFVIVDGKGGMHALSKRITGLTMGETRGRLAGLAEAELPSIEQARAIQQERTPQREKGVKGMSQEQALTEEDQKKQEAQKEEENLHLQLEAQVNHLVQLSKEESQKQKAIQDEEDRKQKVIEEDQQKQNAQKEEAQKEEENRRLAFKEQADRLAQQAEEMEQQERQLEAYKAELAHQAEEGRLQAERERAAQDTARANEREIRNPHYRYNQALGQHYDIRDPYGSLARASMAEYGEFLRDRENLDQQIARTEDPTERQALELRQRIEAADYMTITSERIATQSEIIVGKRNTDEAVKQRERAAAFQKEARELRGQYRELQASRALERTDTGEKRADPPARVSLEPEPKDQSAGIQKSPAAKTGDRGLMVEERPIGKPRGEAQSLSNFVKELPSTQPQRKITYAETLNDPEARKAYNAQITAAQLRKNALDRMGNDTRLGRNLNADDVRKLSCADLENIKTSGDDYLRQLVQERAQEREQTRGR